MRIQSKKYIILSMLLCMLGVSVLFLYRSMHSQKINCQEIGRHTLFVKGALDLSVLGVIQDKLVPIVNEIIKKEVALPSDYDFNFFLAKRKQLVTLYYLYDADTAEMDQLDAVLHKMIQENQKNFILKNVQLSSQLNFFGDHHDELVLMIDDPHKELSLLNQKIKIGMHELNKEYQHTHKTVLYDVSKSERFSYLPHIGLGRIRAASIKKHIKDVSQIDAIYAKITQQILDVASVVVKELLSKNNNRLVFNSVCLFDLELHACVKEYHVEGAEYEKY